jgi:hypothetical protein
MQAIKYNDPLLHYARLSHGMLDLTVRQYEAIERKFLLETRKDVIDAQQLDKCFTQVIILLEDLIGEYKGLTSMILECE